MARVLDAAEAASPVEAVEAVTYELGVALGATSVSFLIADMSGRALVRLAHVEVGGSTTGTGGRLAEGERRDAAESATVLPFDGGPTEQVVRTQQMKVLAPDRSQVASGHPDSWRVLAPVTERGEAIGLLEFLLPDEPRAETLGEISRLAHLLAFVVIANGRHTDLYEWGQRTRPLSLSAEIQHRLLPGPQTCEAGAFTLAGWLEPAADIAGDTFDFSPGPRRSASVYHRCHGTWRGRSPECHPVRGEPAQRTQRGGLVAPTGCLHQQGVAGARDQEWSGGLRDGVDRAPRSANGLPGSGQRRARGPLPGPRGGRRRSRAAGRPAPWPVSRARLSDQPAPSGAGRPACPRHGRNARTQCRECRPSGSHPLHRFSPSFERPSGHWPTRHSRPPAMPSRTSPPSCASTGTATMATRAGRRSARTRLVPANR